jgi:hypothetical protein
LVVVFGGDTVTAERVQRLRAGPARDIGIPPRRERDLGGGVRRAVREVANCLPDEILAGIDGGHEVRERV